MPDDMRGKTRLAGHGLQHEGKPYIFGDLNQGQDPWVRTYDSTGHGRCECGATSPMLATDAARRRWHDAHKQQIRARPTGAEEAAVAATLVKAATSGLDFGGWLAGILARAAAKLGGTEALLASRPGSWEAAAIRDFLHSTYGYEDEYLSTYADSEGSGDG